MLNINALGHSIKKGRFPFFTLTVVDVKSSVHSTLEGLIHPRQFRHLLLHSNDMPLRTCRPQLIPLKEATVCGFTQNVHKMTHYYTVIIRSTLLICLQARWTQWILLIWKLLVIYNPILKGILHIQILLTVEEFQYCSCHS